MQNKVSRSIWVVVLSRFLFLGCVIAVAPTWAQDDDARECALAILHAGNAAFPVINRKKEQVTERATNSAIYFLEKADRACTRLIYKAYINILFGEVHLASSNHQQAVFFLLKARDQVASYPAAEKTRAASDNRKINEHLALSYFGMSDYKSAEPLIQEEVVQSLRGEPDRAYKWLVMLEATLRALGKPTDETSEQVRKAKASVEIRNTERTIAQATARANEEEAAKKRADERKLRDSQFAALEHFQLPSDQISKAFTYEETETAFRNLVNAIQPEALRAVYEDGCHAILRWSHGGAKILEIRSARYKVEGTTSREFKELSRENKSGEGMACISSTWDNSSRTVSPSLSYIFGRDTIDGKEAFRRLIVGANEKMLHDLNNIQDRVSLPGFGQHFKRASDLYRHHPRLQTATREVFEKAVLLSATESARIGLALLEANKRDTQADRNKLGLMIIGDSKASFSDLLDAFTYTNDRRALTRAGELAQTEPEKAKVEVTLMQAIKDRLIVANVSFKGTGNVATADRDLIIARQVESKVVSNASFDVYIDTAIMQPNREYKAKGVIELHIKGTREGIRNCGALWMQNCEFKDENATRVEKVPVEFLLNRGNGYRDRGTKTVEWSSVTGGSGAASGLLMGGTQVFRARDVQVKIIVDSLESL